MCISCYPWLYQSHLKIAIPFCRLVYPQPVSLSIPKLLSISISSWWKYLSLSIPHIYLFGMNFNIPLYLNRYSSQRLLTFYYPSVYPSRQKFSIPFFLVYPPVFRNEVYLILKHVTILQKINYSLSDIYSLTSERVIILMENIVTWCFGIRYIPHFGIRRGRREKKEYKISGERDKLRDNKRVAIWNTNIDSDIKRY